MEEIVYTEKIRSNLTTGIFVVLAGVFLALFGWRMASVGWKFTPGLFLVLGLFFLFYVFNYRTLKIVISDQAIALRFGLVRWNSALENIQECRLDDLPLWIRFGGAGVHFALVEGIYRVFFNFLEGSRVVLLFKMKQGVVKALSFSTRHPEQVLGVLKRRITV